MFANVSTTVTQKIGFACKWIDHPGQVNGIKPTDECKALNTGSTTVAWLNRQTRDQSVEKLWTLMRQNIESTQRLVERVGAQDEQLRMVRLSSDILPVYTESNWSWFWREPDVRLYAERAFAQVGDAARRLGVRVSFHPGQFCVLASTNDGIVDRSIEEFEYHVDMARWMGYGQQFQDMKINVHIAGRQGPEGIRRVLSRLSPEARNTITIENEEISHGLEDCLSIADVVPIVLDVHHHFVREGEYIQANDPRIGRILDSWRGCRPTCHYSISREDTLVDHCQQTLPDMQILLENGHKKSKLRAHSDFMWNTAVNEWMYQHRAWADVMVEAKAKNLASFQLYEFWKNLKK